MLLNNLGYKVTSKQLDWDQMVRASWGAEFSAPDHGVYEFSNGRKFDSTDRSTHGFYGRQPNAINYMMVGDGRYPDMASNVYLLQEDGSRLELL